MDVSDKRNFLLTYGSLVIDEVLKVYEEIETCILYIDAVEKYFILENQNTFEDLLQMFVDSGWKIILTIRTAYMESFHNLLLNTVSVQSYHVNPISKDLLYELLSLIHIYNVPSSYQYYTAAVITEDKTAFLTYGTKKFTAL